METAQGRALAGRGVGGASTAGSQQAGGQGPGTGSVAPKEGSSDGTPLCQGQGTPGAGLPVVRIPGRGGHWALGRGRAPEGGLRWLLSSRFSQLPTPPVAKQEVPGATGQTSSCFWEPPPHTLRGKECALAPSPGLPAPGAPPAQPDTPLALARNSWAKWASWRRRLEPPRGQTREEAGRRGLWAGAYLQQSRRRGRRGPGGGLGAPGRASFSSCPLLHRWALNPIFTLKSLNLKTTAPNPHLQGQ